MTAWEKILQKVLVGSNIDSSQWNSIQAGLRDRAFFSSKVAEMNILDAAQQISSEYAKGEKDLSQLRMKLKEFIEGTGYKPGEGEAGTIKDLTSKARLDVIIKTNVAQARGYVQYAEGMTPGAFAAFPAQEFMRIEHRKQPRTTWPQRWKNAGGKIYGGRMIALKDDPVWTSLSIFGEPFPPFDWGSGMGVMDVDRDEAIELGLITEEELQAKREELRELEKEKALPSMNGNLQAEMPEIKSVKGFEEFRERFNLGDQVVRNGTRIKWRAELIRESFTGNKPFKINLGKPTENLKQKLTAKQLEMLKDKSFTVTDKWLDRPRKTGGTHRDHFQPKENDPRNIPLTSGDLDLIPSLWRNPERVNTGDDGASICCEMDTIDGGVLTMYVRISKTPDIKTLYKRKIRDEIGGPQLGKGSHRSERA